MPGFAVGITAFSRFTFVTVLAFAIVPANEGYASTSWCLSWMRTNTTMSGTCVFLAFLLIYLASSQGLVDVFRLGPQLQLRHIRRVYLEVYCIWAADFDVLGLLDDQPAISRRTVGCSAGTRTFHFRSSGLFSSSITALLRFTLLLFRPWPLFLRRTACLATPRRRGAFLDAY